VQSPGEQVGLESLVEAGEQLCCPEVSRELITTVVPEQRRVGTWQSDACS